jgi:hypothetical protein
VTRAAVLERLNAAEAAIREARALLEAEVAPPRTPAAPSVRPLAWGAKVSPTFRERVIWLAEDLDIGAEPGKPEPNWLMTCMAWESGRSFRSDVKNMAGSGATGLIQFMPSTARGLGTTTDKLATLTPEDQLNWVWKYFRPYDGRLRSLADVYMAILWPAAVGKPESHALFTGGIAYRQNAGLDVDKDGRVTKREAAAKVAALLPEGLKPGNVA